jgi:SAM-dependent methyltransferase
MASPTQNPRPQANALAAQAWAEIRELLDLQLSPLGLRAIEALAPKPAEVIVDIGCGAGQTVLQLAQIVGPGGQVIGVDIAPLLLTVARQRAEGLSQVSFIECDALRLDLPKASVDGFFSRFGVMAFADPVAAFANFHRIMRPSGRLAFVCWRSLIENELDLLPLRAAGLEAMLDPTPFSFAKPDYVRATLQTAGFQQISITAHDEAVSSGDLDAMAAVLLRVGPLGGPLGKILRENPELRPEAEPRLRAALGARGARSHIALTAATWIVTARA